MRGEFYTERDIVDLARKGVRHLDLKDEDRITDVARERAIKEGMRISRPPSEAAKRPEYQAPALKSRSAAAAPSSRQDQETGLEAKIRSTVIAKLGGAVDPKLVDDVIRRVLDQLGLH